MGKNLQTSQKEKFVIFGAARQRYHRYHARVRCADSFGAKADGLYFLFEKRAATIKQPGDVCFPGGRLEAGRASKPALRETYEEIGCGILKS